MAHCLQAFLQNGLFESEPINLHLTKLINNTSEEFVEWGDSSIQINNQLDKINLYDRFIKAYPEYKARLKQRDFTFWLRAWGGYKNYLIHESHSGDVRYIKFQKNHSEDDMEATSGTTNSINNEPN